MKTKNEYVKFEALARGIVAAPHSEIEAKLEAEKNRRKNERILSFFLKLDCRTQLAGNFGTG